AGFGYTQIVPHTGLRAFAAATNADPMPGNADAPFEVFPAGARPSYCFSRLGVAANRSDPMLLELGVPGHDLFEVIAPVYRGGGVPDTRAARRRLATGWVIGLFDTEPILRAAVAGQA